MYISQYSFLMTILWSNFILCVILLFLKKRQFIKYFGIRILVAIYFLCAIRLLIPVEMPFVYIVGLEGSFSEIYELIFLRSYSVWRYEIKISEMLCILWLLGILGSGISWSFHYFNAMKKIRCSEKYHDDNITKVFGEVKKKNKKIEVSVYKTRGITIPMGVGIVRKYILLPDVKYSEKELYYVLLHEYTHLVNRDLETKALLHILKIIFWWNPCIHYLKREVDQILEIKCDLNSTATMGKDEKAEYLETLLSMIKQCDWKKGYNERQTAVQIFSPRNDRKIVERFQIILDAEKHHARFHKIPVVLCMLFVCLTLCATYCVQIQPEYQPSTDELSPEHEGTAENVRIIDNGDGTFTLVDMSNRGKSKTIDDREFIEQLTEQGFLIEKKEGVKK